MADKDLHILDIFDELMMSDAFNGVTFEFKEGEDRKARITLLRNSAEVTIEGVELDTITYLSPDKMAGVQPPVHLKKSLRCQVDIQNFPKHAMISIEGYDQQILLYIWENYVFNALKNNNFTYIGCKILTSKSNNSNEQTQKTKLDELLHGLFNSQSLTPIPPRSPPPEERGPVRGSLAPKQSGGSRKRYEDLTVKELCERCKKRGIKYSGLKKAELVSALRKK